MTKVNFVLPDGSVRSVATDEGESLMKAAVRNMVEGIEGECGGELTCATCHVHIGEPWKSRLRPPSPDEVDILDMSTNVTDESRLACQIRVADDLEGLTARVATEP